MICEAVYLRSNPSYSLFFKGFPMAVDPADLDPAALVLKAPLPVLNTIDPNNGLKAEEDLVHIRNFRAIFVNALSGQGLPADLDDRKMILQILKDMDGSAMSAIRIKAESESTDKMEQMRLMASEMMNLAMKGNIIRSRDVVDVIPRDVGGVPVLPDDDTIRPFIPGEATQGTVHNTFELFQKTGGDIELKGVDEEI